MQFREIFAQTDIETDILATHNTLLPADDGVAKLAWSYGIQT